MKLAILTFATLMLLTLVPATDVAAQGRGRGRWHNDDKWDKKCDKFVNCHDARDGRWDNRGPRRRALVGSRYYSPHVRNRVYNGNRYRRWNSDRIYVRNRRRW